MTQVEFGLAQKLPSCVVESEQSGDRIVERQQPINAHSREEWTFRL